MAWKYNVFSGQFDFWGGVDSAILSFFNGTFRESFNALVTSDGATVTMSIEQSGGGDLTMNFSDGLSTLDCTPALTTTLTAGTDAAPTTNYVYVLQSDKILTVSTSDWPTVEHIKVSFFLVPSAGFVQTNGVYVNQNWNDHLEGTNNQGHLAHMAERSRKMGAIWHSGVEGAGTDGYLTPTASNVELKATAGVSYQMHRHTIPAFDTSVTDMVLVKNWSGDAYHDITNLYDIVADSTGTSIGTNKYFNLVVWAVCNKGGEYTPMMINLPSGSYATQSDAENDVDGYDDFSIPREFNTDSSTGLLIARITCQKKTTWVVTQTVDLRNSSISATGGGAGAILWELVADVIAPISTPTRIILDAPTIVGDKTTIGTNVQLDVFSSGDLISRCHSTGGHAFQRIERPNITKSSAFSYGVTTLLGVPAVPSTYFMTGQKAGDDVDIWRLGDDNFVVTYLLYNTSTLHLELLGSLFMQERGSPVASAAARGQIWVKNTTPNQFWFTDDAGTDYQITGNSGDTLPTSPVTSQYFLHTPTGRKILYFYDGSAWSAVKSIGAMTVYVDEASGTDSLDKGTASGASAFATRQYAADSIPPTVGGNVIVYLANETSTTGDTAVEGKQFEGAYSLTYEGTLPTADVTGTASAGAAYSMGAAGDGAVRATLTDAGSSWTIGTVLDSGNCDGIGASTSILNDSGQNFTTTCQKGMIVENTTDSTWAYVVEVVSATQLRISADIMDDGENFQIGWGEHTNKLLVITGGTGSGQERVIDASEEEILHIVGVWDTTPDNTSTFSIYDLTTGTTIDLSASSGGELCFTVANQKNVIFRYINMKEWHGANVMRITNHSVVSIFSCRFESSRTDRFNGAAFQVDGYSVLDQYTGNLIHESGGTHITRLMRLQLAAAPREDGNIRNSKFIGGTIGITVAASAYVAANVVTVVIGAGLVFRSARGRAIDVNSFTRYDIDRTIIIDCGTYGVLVATFAYFIIRNNCEIDGASSHGILMNGYGETQHANSGTQINRNGGYGLNSTNHSFGLLASTFSYTGNTTGTYTADASSHNT